MLSLILQLTGFILAVYVFLIAIFKLHAETFRWYSINLLSAYSILSVVQVLGELNFIEFYRGELRAIFFRQYVTLWSFAAARLIVLFCIFEVHCIYSTDYNALSAIYQKKWLPHLLIHAFSQLLALPVFLPAMKRFSIPLYFTLFKTVFGSVIIAIYIASVTAIIDIIWTICHHKHHNNKLMIRRLTPLLFYFLPITLFGVTFPISIVALTLESYVHIGRTVIEISVATVWFTNKFQLLVAAVCTITVIPAYRNATLDLLHLRRKRNSKVAVVHVTRI